jgi:hypothetical protein
MTYFEVENVGGPFGINTGNPHNELPTGEATAKKVVIAKGIKGGPKEVEATCVGGKTFCSSEAIRKGRSPLIS